MREVAFKNTLANKNMSKVHDNKIELFQLMLFKCLYNKLEQFLKSITESVFSKALGLYCKWH